MRENNYLDVPQLIFKYKQNLNLDKPDRCQPKKKFYATGIVLYN
jgi:hypothetical protein